MHSLTSLYTLRVKNSFGSVKPLYCVPEEINWGTKTGSSDHDVYRKPRHCASRRERVNQNYWSTDPIFIARAD